MLVVTLTFDSAFEPSIEELAEVLHDNFDAAPVLIEDSTPVTPDTPADQRYIGYAHIYVPDPRPLKDPTRETGPHPDLMYASCPMSRKNLPLLEVWLKRNHRALAKGE